jgi:mannose-6-phosphate isomerase-like protein (cupin superfamily)
VNPSDAATGRADRNADHRLLDEIQSFVAGWPHPTMQHFAEGVADWGSDRIEVAPQMLPVAEIVVECLAHTNADTHELLSAFIDTAASRKWEQSYTKADAVSSKMLAGYGYAEVISKLGPFVSDRTRAGIGVWGSAITYPPHRHAAEELYLVLGGGAEFLLGEEGSDEIAWRGPGEMVHVTPHLRHGFRTQDQPLALFYVWRDGDLREKSTFS